MNKEKVNNIIKILQAYNNNEAIQFKLKNNNKDNEIYGYLNNIKMEEN